ncbi:MAG: sugar transporter subunit [Nocardioidaceae bacterium]|nr:sugar transporter subunit [Nocardioidaceae bacterium]
MTAGGRIGLVLVSHVSGIADGVRDLVGQMAPDVTVTPAGGTDDGGIGTSFDRVATALEQADAGAGAVVLYDLGSALLTTETALDLLDDEARARVRVAEAPLVEGAIAAAVEAQGGGDLAAVLAAAESAGGGVPPVEASRPGTVPGAVPGADSGADSPADSGADNRLRTSETLVNKVGLHARPAGALARALSALDADVRVGRPGDEGVNARSVLSVIALGLENGQQVEFSASGPDAQQALDTATRLTRERFGDEE